MNELKKISFDRAEFIIGCEQLGGYQWGKVDIEAVREALNLALDSGVGFFDTADCYGNGLSEERLGETISGRRPEAFVATKYGVKLTKGGVVYDSSPGYAKKALEASLLRLKTDYIDLYQMHYWDGVTPFDDILAVLERFCEEGKIRFYGFTNVSTLPESAYLSANLRTASLEYSLANRTNEKAALSFSEKGLKFMSYGSLGQGILSGKYSAESKFGKDDRRSRVEYKNFHGEKLEKNLKIVKKLSCWHKKTGVSIPLLAISWIKRSIPSSIPIIGIKSTRQLKLFMDDYQIPHVIYDELDALSAVNVE